MSDIAKMIVDVLQTLLAEECSAEKLRHYERAENSVAIEQFWQKINDLGFADLCLPEEQNGAALSLAELGDMVFLFGYYLLPLPLADSIVARLFLQQSRQPIPEGMVVLGSVASSKINPAVEPLTLSTLFADRASTALLQVGDNWFMAPIEKPNTVKALGYRSALASFTLTNAKPIKMNPDLPPLQVVMASLRAAEMAGMMAKLLELSVNYANERSQFGKAIGQFQAIQQQLSVLAEESAAARMASRMAFNGKQFTAISAATAKMRAGIAATKAAAIAHGVHGAIGFSEEYDLQLYSRRLLESRIVAGSESYWAEAIGRVRFESKVGTSLEFVRGCGL